MHPPTFFYRPLHKNVVPSSVEDTDASPFHLPSVLWSVMCAVVDSDNAHNFPACHSFVSSQITSSEVPDAFQHQLLNTACSSDLRLKVNFHWHFVTLPFPCAHHFQASAHKAMQRVNHWVESVCGLQCWSRGPQSPVQRAQNSTCSMSRAYGSLMPLKKSGVHWQKKISKLVRSTTWARNHQPAPATPRTHDLAPLERPSELWTLLHFPSQWPMPLPAQSPVQHTCRLQCGDHHDRLCQFPSIVLRNNISQPCTDLTREPCE